LERSLRPKNGPVYDRRAPSRGGRVNRWRQPVVPLRAVPWLILGGALLFTAGTALVVRAAGMESDQARFENAVLSTEVLIQRRLQLYITTLRGTAGLYSALDTVTMQDFGEYVARLEIQSQFPGIQGVGWTERLRAEADGEGGVSEVHAIQYLEPMDVRNRAALGFDMYSEATRRAAMARARDEAVPAMSGKVRLVQEIDENEQAGFLIYFPVYRGSGVPGDVASRRAQLRGFVYSPFRADDLFMGIFGAEQYPRTRFRVYDGEEVSPEQQLHASDGGERRPARMRATRSMTVAGRPWTVVYESSPLFERSLSPVVPLPVVLLGLAASLWLFFLARGLARAREAAEAANQAKSSFLATMSHELRTPLNAIAGYADLLALEVAGELNPKQRAFLDRIEHARKHLLGLIDDVLDFARLEAGRLVVRSREVDVATVVTEVEAMLAADVAVRGLTYSRQDGDAATVWADPEKVRQILINLVGNAVKFTDVGGEVTVRWKSEAGMVRIEVADTGTGIAPEQLESIFSPFVQGDADLTRTRQGTGLGLAISRQLAWVMGGEIVVDSEPGRGSTFALILPETPGIPPEQAEPA
jgi:signal transduction histidine kinase